MKKELTWRKAIEKVLSESNGSMHYKDIASQIAAEGLRKIVGATPAATVRATVTSSLIKEGKNSPFQKISPGEYVLRASDKGDLDEAESKSYLLANEQEEQYEVVTSFGMFWRRNFVNWSSSPHILGMQQIGAAAVNFENQIGIYLLYDAREVIYVGRATQRPIGKRLYEHTSDRLATRWDRFSWFGLLPVKDDSSLGELPTKIDSTKLIPALEAILIEALEPRQNRKRGEGLSAVEYIQKLDPEVEKRRKRAVLRDVMNEVE